MHVVWVIWLNSANRHLGTIKLQDVFAVQPQSPSPQSDYIAQHVVYVPRGNCTLSNVYRTYWRQRSRGSGALKRAHDWTLHTPWQPYWQLNYNFWTFIVRWKCCIFFGSHFQIAGLVWAAVSNRRKKLHSRSSKSLLFYLDKGLQELTNHFRVTIILPAISKRDKRVTSVWTRCWHCHTSCTTADFVCNSHTWHAISISFPSFSLTHAHFLVFYELMLEMWFFLKEISQILHQIE